MLNHYLAEQPTLLSPQAQVLICIQFIRKNRQEQGNFHNNDLLSHWRHSYSMSWQHNGLFIRPFKNNKFQPSKEAQPEPEIKETTEEDVKKAQRLQQIHL